MPVSAGGPVRTIAGSTLPRGFPPLSGAGIQAFSRESPDAKSRRGFPPAPPGIKPLAGARSIFWVGRRSKAVEGFIAAHVRAPIWKLSFGRIFFGWTFPSPLPPSINPRFPARPAGGRAVTGVGQMGRRPGKKRRRTPAGSPQTRKGGAREEEPLPPWCSFPRLSPKKVGLPRGHRRGPRGAAPQGGFGATHP